MPALSRALAAGLPAIPLEVRSTSSRWLSVAAGHQVVAARRAAPPASASALATTCAAYVAERAAAPPRAAPPRCPRSCGCAGRPAGQGRRPCRSPFACSASVRIIAPRGPRSVLCVVVVITGAWPTGDGCAPRRDQAGDVRDVGDENRANLVGDRREGREVRLPRYGGPPQMMIFGRSAAPGRARRPCRPGRSRGAPRSARPEPACPSPTRASRG